MYVEHTVDDRPEGRIAHVRLTRPDKLNGLTLQTIHELAATARKLRAAGVSRDGLLRASAGGVLQTAVGLGRVTTQLAAPALLAGLRFRRFRIASAVLLSAAPLHSWFTTRPAGGAARFVAERIADDLAYGAGVWTGALRARTSVPLRPRLAR